MSTPFMGEIKLVSFNFAPKGWAECTGQLLPINQNQALFSLLGTVYGGNGQTNFALPNLRGSVPIHMGSGHTLGEKAGTTAVTVNIQQLPTHLHALQGSADNAVSKLGTGGFLAQSTAVYHGPTTLTTLEPSSVTSTGGSQAHNNMMPYLVLNFVIALQGMFPSQS